MEDRDRFEWRKIPGCPDYVRVNDVGTVIEVEHERMLRGSPAKMPWRVLPIGYDEWNYQLVTVGGKMRRVHSLVALAFIPQIPPTPERLLAYRHHPNRPPPKPCLEVNHKNGIKWDNRVENLEWVTRSEQMRHAWHALGGIWNIRKRFLTENAVRKIRRLASEKSISQIAREVGSTYHAVRAVLRRETWKHFK